MQVGGLVGVGGTLGRFDRYERADQEILDHLKQNLDLMLSDNTLAFNLQQDGSYRRISKNAQESEINSQLKLLEWYAEENPFGSV